MCVGGRETPVDERFFIQLRTINDGMNHPTRHWQPREARFLALIALSLVLIALSVAESQRVAGHPGSGHRVIDRQALERRIDAGELRDREATWYHPATPDETRNR